MMNKKEMALRQESIVILVLCCGIFLLILWSLFSFFIHTAHGQQSSAASSNQNVCSGYAANIISHADPSKQILTLVYEFWYSNHTHSCLYSYYQYIGATASSEKLGVADVETGKDVWSQMLSSMESVPSATDALDTEQAALQ